MEITKDEIQSMIYDPTVMQKYILEFLDDATKGEMSITDPTSPFVMALETAVTCAAAAVQETSNQIRKQYPHLADTSSDLMHHITENESSYMFAIPSEATIRFMVNAIDLRNNGIAAVDGSYHETIIPSGTTIKVLGVTLTTLNDILVRLYTNNSVFVEQQLDTTNDIAYEDTSVLEPHLESDGTGTSWIWFDTKVKQVKKHSFNKSVTIASGFSQLVDLEDYFCHAIVKYKGNNSSYYKTLNKMFNDEYIDPITPGVIVKVYDKKVLFKIPDQYLIEGIISGNVKIDLYETKGYQYLPIHKYNSEDFSYELGDTGKNEIAATSKNIAIQCRAAGILEGGKNASTVEELRAAIINNTTGDIDLPITEKQIEKYGDINGYTIIKSLDIITEREFLGLKSVPSYDSNLLMAFQNVFFNTAKITISELTNHSNIIVRDESFVIKSGNVFRNNNSIFSVLDDSEIDYIKALNNYTLIEYIKANRLFYNPFYYIIEKSENYINSRVYDLDNPVIQSNMIKEKNITLQQRVNIRAYSIKKIRDGYRLAVSLVSSEDFKKLDKKSLVLQLKIPLFTGSNFAYINADYDSIKDIYTFDILTNLDINSDDRLDLINGYSDLVNKEFNLLSDVYLYICTTDTGVLDPTNFLTEEIYSNGKYMVVFTKQLLNIKFGEKLTYIHNNLYNVYGERKYKRYKEDIPLVYEADVYEVDPDTGCIVTVIKGTSGKDIQYNILHKKGDPVLDENKNPVYKYKQGDPVLDEDGNPVIDLDSGIVRYIDMLMLEYEFYLSTNNAYTNYNGLVIDSLKSYITDELVEMNKKLLEKTTIKYKSFNNTSNITISVNNMLSYIPYNCSPNVVLYINTKDVISNELKESYKTQIGSILNSHFNKSEIVLEDIRNEIKSKLGNTVSGVKLTGLDPADSEVITVKDTTNRLCLNKILDINKNNELIVKYDIDIEITYV